MEAFLKKPGCAQGKMTRPTAQSFNRNVFPWNNVNLMNASKVRHVFVVVFVWVFGFCCGFFLFYALNAKSFYFKVLLYASVS